MSDEKNIGCGCESDLGLEKAVDPKEGIVVRSKAGIANGNYIATFNEGGKIIYELQDKVISPPSVTFTTDAPVTEVGDTVDVVNFNGSIEEGTENIVSRSITPDPGGLDLTAPFAFQKLSVKRNTPGVAEQHTLTAQDAIGNIVSKQAGIPFKHAFYMGYSTAAELTEAGIKALVNKNLVDSIQAQYGGEKDYVVPATPAGLKYLYWCYPVGTPGIQGIILSGLPFPTVILPNVTVTNIHDPALLISYVVIRSANKFGSTTLNLTLT